MKLSTVICDVCNRDYTGSDEKGGFVFGSYGVCPRCAGTFMKTVEEEAEERFIKAICPEDCTFYDFIIEYRKR